jgi:hypothetical protein
VARLQRRSRPHKNDVSGDHNVISAKIKVAIPFVVRGIADEDTLGGTRSKLMRGCRRQLGVASTPKDPKMLISRQCIVEGGVKTKGSDDFCWKMVQQICGSVEALCPILWWLGSLK